jgi:hypothetical protein
MTAMSVLVVLLAAVVALLAVIVAGLLRSHAEILRSLAELRADRSDRAGSGQPGPGAVASGAAAWDLTGMSPAGDPVTVAVTDVDHSSLIVFLTSTCTSCLDLWNRLADPHSRRASSAPVLVVVTESADVENAGRIRKLAPHGVTVVMSDAAWDDYGVPAAPYFVLVDGRSGTIADEIAGGDPDDLDDLLLGAADGSR